MPLSAGERLGPYEILAPIGAGGMGEVYKARDTRLGRIVAIKVSKEQFSDRFEREAKAIAALNHPKICQLYDVGPNYLVMEFVEGQPLKGPLPLEEALRFAAEIAEALTAAHEKGIVHRDLKPGNILVTADDSIKVLDFGLAKVTATASSPSLGEDSPTLTMGMTQAGVILGTAAYMSPEQARGKTVTTRADIWAFGVVLYELLTGRRPFRGEDLTELLAAVVKEQPDLNAAPYQVRRLLEACFQKDPQKRMQAIGDWTLLLDREPAPPAPAPEPKKEKSWLWPAIAAALAMVAAGVSFLHFRETPPPPASVLNLAVPLPADSQATFLALSPDGRRLAVVLMIQRKPQLYVRSLDSREFHLLEGTENPRTPFWSGDSRFIGFFADGKLKVVPAAGGPATALCAETGLGFGGTWSRAGNILFASGNGVLYRVSGSGGACAPVKFGDDSFRSAIPTFFPDGDHFIVAAGNPGDPSSAGLYLGSLQGSKPRKILNDLSSALYAPPVSGRGAAHLLFLRGSALMAQPFDPDKLEVVGDPFSIAPNASVSPTPPQMAASIAENGTLIYLSNYARVLQLTWFDRSGSELGKVGDRGNRVGMSLSPDGTTLAMGWATAADPAISIRLLDLVRNSESRFTPSGREAYAPVWSPDGARIVYSSAPAGKSNLFLKDVNGGQEIALLPPGTFSTASDWSRDGRYLIYTGIDPKTQADIWYLENPGKPDSKPVKFISSDSVDSQGQLSPDGHWLAYCSNDGDTTGVYVRSFPDGKRVTSIANYASEPRWNKNGSELYYLARASLRPNQTALMAVRFQVDGSGNPARGSSQQIVEFQARTFVPQSNNFAYSPHPDGKRFLVNVNPADTRSEVIVLTNWDKGARDPNR